MRLRSGDVLSIPAETFCDITVVPTNPEAPVAELFPVGWVPYVAGSDVPQAVRWWEKARALDAVYV
eukprot:COSAG01_NODE_3073_length_6635_cov_9.100061_6_plen_66_part_00